MRISYRELKRCQVKTVSGVVLGKIRDIEIQTDGQHVDVYHVAKSLFGSRLAIHREQIVRFESGAMIVDDTVVRSTEKKSTKQSSAASPSPVAMRK